VTGNIFRYIEHEGEVRNSFKIFIGNLNGSDKMQAKNGDDTARC
jgi:hypothetical protein